MEDGGLAVSIQDMTSGNAFRFILAALLVLQGVVSAVPHDHGETCCSEPVLDAPATVQTPHHCLACSVHAPATTAGVEVAVIRSEAAAAPVAAVLPARVFSASVESLGPRGPPRVI